MTDVLKDIESKFGKGSIFKLGSKEVEDIEAFSTGILGLDATLGIKGFPRGRISEVFGLESSGKTCLALAAVADAQRRGYNAAYIDVEHSLDTETAEMMGVNVDDLYVSQPDDGHAALEILLALVKSEQFAIVVLDSVAALTPKQEAEADEFGASYIGVQARMMSQAMRKLVSPIGKSNTCVIFLNQQRVDIQAAGYGDGLTTTGGKALKYGASVRVQLKKLTQIKEGDETVGHNVKAVVVKNKLAAPFKNYQYQITYGNNNVQLDEVINQSIDYGFIKKGGAWFTVADQKLQGVSKVRTFLVENPEIYEDLKLKVVDCLQKYVVEGQKRDKKSKDGDE